MGGVSHAISTWTFPGLCIRRNCHLQQGLYAKARQGFLKGFTGIDDHYEPPFQAEITLNTLANSEEENARLILDYLIQRGLIDSVQRARA